jgi:hypothetical protein
VISNVPIRDPRVSAETLGFLAYLLSFSDDWRLTHKDLMRRFSIGRDKTYGIINELIEAGYVNREEMRSPSAVYRGLWIPGLRAADDFPLRTSSHLAVQKDYNSRDESPERLRPCGLNATSRTPLPQYGGV